MTARARAELDRLGLAHVTAAYVPERHVVSLSWPHREGTTALEGVEFTATPEWLERMRPVLEAMARHHRAD